jgi:predicted ArsR family transcriptional regulator
MPTSRQRILAYIRKHRTASSADISCALGMTPANARHHLAHLEANGLIEVIGQQRGEGRGRPVQVYGLSRHTLEDNVALLASVLLEEWLTNLPPKKQEEHLRALTQRMANGGSTSNSTAGVQNASFPQRLTQAVERLNEMHYQARWEAGMVGPRILLGYCPYMKIIHHHPELCQMDVFLLEEFLGYAIRQTAKLQVSAQGLPFCEFLLRTGASSIVY